MRYYLGHVKDIELEILTSLLGNELDVPGPRGEVTLGDVLEEILSGIILVSAREITGLFGGKVFDTLVGLEVILHVVDFPLVVNPFVGVRGVAVHVSIAIGGSSIREEDSDLVKSFGRHRPEVPSGISVSQVGLRVSFLGVNEVGELDRILNEEHGGVVADHIVVAFFCVELYGEATRVSVSVSRSKLSGHGGESEEERGPLAY